MGNRAGQWRVKVCVCKGGQGYGCVCVCKGVRLDLIFLYSTTDRGAPALRLLLCWAEDVSLPSVSWMVSLLRTLRQREKKKTHTHISNYPEGKMTHEAVISQCNLNLIHWLSLRNQSPTNTIRHLPPGFLFCISSLLDFNPVAVALNSFSVFPISLCV